MITPTDSSSRAASNARIISTTVCGRNALRTSGRVIVIFASPGGDEAAARMSSYSPAGGQGARRAAGARGAGAAGPARSRRPRDRGPHLGGDGGAAAGRADLRQLAVERAGIRRGARQLAAGRLAVHAAAQPRRWALDPAA